MTAPSTAAWQKALGALLAASVIGAYTWVWTTQARVALLEAQVTSVQAELAENASIPTDIALIKQDLKYMREQLDEIKRTVLGNRVVP
jgi:hypothetical protein